MIVTKIMYKRLSNYLDKTRKSLPDVCKELGIDWEMVDESQLLVTQCTHCDVWTKRVILDLDKNPICYLCRDLVGM